jgi:hypothetical protein
VFRDGTWFSLPCELVGLGKGELDVAVLRAKYRLTDPAFTVGSGFGECAIGQDMYFAGFPYKMWADYGEVTGGHAGVFLKKGTLAAVLQGPPRTFYVDAINNEGFSGAPLYYFRNNNMQDPYVAGIVSKFRIEYEPVTGNDGEETGLRVAYNTGLLVAYDVKHALELARSID